MSISHEIREWSVCRPALHNESCRVSRELAAPQLVVFSNKTWSPSPNGRWGEGRFLEFRWHWGRLNSFALGRQQKYQWFGPLPAPQSCNLRVPWAPICKFCISLSIAKVYIRAPKGCRGLPRLYSWWGAVCEEPTVWKTKGFHIWLYHIIPNHAGFEALKFYSYPYIHIYIYYLVIYIYISFIEGSLEVKLPTIWTDEKQSRAEAERRERLEERRVEEKESEERRCRFTKR